ncbi:PKD-like domain-containing protein, partial [Arthrospira platensis SPKY1]|nr:PKD-like domain-containing protein [Arthrospira platensis SPKY1]
TDGTDGSPTVVGFQPSGSCTCPTGTTYGTTASAQATMICSGETAVLDVASTSSLPNKAFKWSADGDAGSDATGAAGVGYGAGVISDGPLTNTTGADIVVTYTMQTYTFGPNGIDEDGAGDDCLGDPVTADVTVKPEPTGANTTYAVCSGAILNIDLQSLISNSVLSDFEWVAVDNGDIYGENTTTQYSSVIGNQLELVDPGNGVQI